jgi:membrane dipeptidase
MQNTFPDYSRRQFLAVAAGAGGALLLNPLFAKPSDDIDPRVAAIVAKTIGIDVHNHIDVPLNGSELPGPAIDLAGELKKSGLAAVCMTFAVDYQKLVNPGDAYNRFIAGLDAMDKALKDNDIKRAFNLSDLQTAHKNILRPSFNRWRALIFSKANWKGWSLPTNAVCGTWACCMIAMHRCRSAIFIPKPRNGAG